MGFLFSREIQEAPDLRYQAAPLSLTLSKLLIAPVWVFVLTSETAIPPPYPVVFIRSKRAPLLRPFTWSGFDL